MINANGYKLPLSAVALCCVVGLTLLNVPDHGKCVMTYMLPSYFSIGEFAKLKHPYDLYLYKEGRHAFKNARKVHLFFTM